MQVKQISGNEIYLLIKYIKSVLWRVAKCQSYTEEARCLKVKHHAEEDMRRTSGVNLSFLQFNTIKPRRKTASEPRRFSIEESADGIQRREVQCGHPTEWATHTKRSNARIVTARQKEKTHTHIGQKKHVPQFLPHISHRLSATEANSGVRGEKPATNPLSWRTGLSQFVSWIVTCGYLHSSFVQQCGLSCKFLQSIRRFSMFELTLHSRAQNEGCKLWKIWDSLKSTAG